MRDAVALLHQAQTLLRDTITAYVVDMPLAPPFLLALTASPIFDEPPPVPNPLLYLPALISKIVGSPHAATVSLSASWLLIHATAKAFDDIADGESNDPASAVTLGMALLGVAHQLLHPYDAEVSRSLSIHVTQASVGQYRDILAQRGAIPTPQIWLEIALTKSGAFFGWACYAGAFIAGASPQQREALQTYGKWLGVLLQIADDYNDLWKSARGVALCPRVMLPVIYAHHVEPQALVPWMECASITDPQAIETLRETVMALGGQMFMRKMVANALIRAEESLSTSGIASAQLSPLYALARAIWYGTCTPQGSL